VVDALLGFDRAIADAPPTPADFLGARKSTPD
jgi:hypothetical protein